MPAESNDLLERYRQKGLANHLGFGRCPAVLVIDFIGGFTDPDSPLGSDLDAEVSATAELLAVARRTGRDVFFTTTAYDPEMTEAGLFVDKVPVLEMLQRGSAAVQIDARLDRQPGESVVEKQYASAFFGTDLAATLHERGVDTLLLAGCTTSGCVRASAVDAMQHGFRPIVVEPCVGDRSTAQHRANLLDIQAKYGDVVGLARVLAYLEEETET
jgi:nicotinamidase-related amidase